MGKFFRILFPEYEDKMRIPDYFARLLNDQSGIAANTASISSPLGTTWHVGLSRDRTDTYFTNGWPAFLEAHEMEIGYLMVFSYEGKSNFSVEIFDKTTCLKEYSYSSDIFLDAVPRSNSSNSDTGYEAGKSEYTKGANDSESSYTSFEVPNNTTFRDGKGKKVLSNVDHKETQNLESNIKLRSGAIVHKEVNQRGTSLNNRSEPVKNLDSNALANTGCIFKTIREVYNLSYMPLKKKFCDNSPYKLTNGIATVRTENSQLYTVRYRVCGNYNFLGRGWRIFCVANGVSIGDRCRISIVGDNEFLVNFKRQYPVVGL